MHDFSPKPMYLLIFLFDCAFLVWHLSRQLAISTIVKYSKIEETGQCLKHEKGRISKTRDYVFVPYLIKIKKTQEPTKDSIYCQKPCCKSCTFPYCNGYSYPSNQSNQASKALTTKSNKNFPDCDGSSSQKQSQLKAKVFNHPPVLASASSVASAQLVHI